MTFEIPQQEAITMDNVQLDLDAVLYVRIVDPYKVPIYQSFKSHKWSSKKFFEFNLLTFLNRQQILSF